MDISCCSISDAMSGMVLSSTLSISSIACEVCASSSLS